MPYLSGGKPMKTIKKSLFFSDPILLRGGLCYSVEPTRGSFSRQRPSPQLFCPVSSVACTYQGGDDGW